MSARPIARRLEGFPDIVDRPGDAPMTDAERRLAREVWFLEYGRIGRSNNDSYPILHKLQNTPVGRAISDYHRNYLLKLAWENRHRLPPDLAVLVALKGAV